jgi:hypothetical protein
MLGNTARLAAMLLADRPRAKPERTDIAKCFMCGVGMMYRGNRFCSDRCREFYDTGNAGYEQDWRRPEIVYRDRAGSPMKMGPRGFIIPCAHCRKEFDSRGLRCCSPECEHAYREREDNLAVLAKVGIEVSAKRACLECGVRIPTWRNGRKVSSATRFCSPKCAQRAKRRPTASDGVLSVETLK